MEANSINIREDYFDLIDDIQTTLLLLREKISDREFEAVEFVRNKESHFFPTGYMVTSKNGKISTDRDGVDRIMLRERISELLEKFKGGEKGFAMELAIRIKSELETLKLLFEMLATRRGHDYGPHNPKLLFQE